MKLCDSCSDCRTNQTRLRLNVQYGQINCTVPCSSAEFLNTGGTHDPIMSRTTKKTEALLIAWMSKCSRFEKHGRAREAHRKITLAYIKTSLALSPMEIITVGHSCCFCWYCTEYSNQKHPLLVVKTCMCRAMSLRQRKTENDSEKASCSSSIQKGSWNDS